MTTLPDKWVRLMCDFSAEPVWAKNGSNAELSDLPVPEMLRKSLRDWQLQYEARMELTGYPISNEGVSEVERQTSKEGASLAFLVKCQLPDWTVILYDHDLGNQLVDDKGLLWSLQ